MVLLDEEHRIAVVRKAPTYQDPAGQVGDYYVVTAINQFGESGPSNTAQAQQAVPPPPFGLEAEYVSGPPAHVVVQWEHPWSEGVTYNVYRNSRTPVPLQLKYRIAAGLTEKSYDDSSGQEGYWYVVTAVNGSGESGPSNEARAERRSGGKGEGGMALGGVGGEGGEECPPGCYWSFVLGECVCPPPPPPPPTPPQPVVRKYYFLGSQRIALRISGNPDPAGNGLFFFHVDQLGSTSLLSTITGTLAAGSETRFLPYGEYRVEPEADLTDHGFTGHKQQDAVGLIYMRARYYIAAVGRFVSADSQVPDPSDPQSYNRYSLSVGNPLRYVDPTGHYHEDVHYYMTYGLVYDAAMKIAVGSYGLSRAEAQRIAEGLATQVASGDQWADDTRNLGNLSPFPGTNHWMSHHEAVQAVQESIDDPTPDAFAFGFNLHAVQDYYAHFGLGYIAQLGRDGLLSWYLTYSEDDQLSATGADLEMLNPFSLGERILHTVDWGHGATTLFDVLDPDAFDFDDPWDQAMLAESEYFIWNFLVAYYQALFGAVSPEREDAITLPIGRDE